jgi:hypothetical protein
MSSTGDSSPRSTTSRQTSWPSDVPWLPRCCWVTGYLRCCRRSRSCVGWHSRAEPCQTRRRSTPSGRAVRQRPAPKFPDERPRTGAGSSSAQTLEPYLAWSTSLTWQPSKDQRRDVETAMSNRTQAALASRRTCTTDTCTYAGDPVQWLRDMPVIGRAFGARPSPWCGVSSGAAVEGVDEPLVELCACRLVVVRRVFLLLL